MKTSQASGMELNKKVNHMTAQKYEYRIIYTDKNTLPNHSDLRFEEESSKVREIHENTLNIMAKAGWEVVNMCSWAGYSRRESLLKREYKT